MNFPLVFVLAFSIAIPAIAGAVRIKNISQIYFPFLFCIWIGFINECVSFVLIQFYHVSNAINSNIYSLIEALLYTWFFANLNLFGNTKTAVSLVVFICSTWLLDNFFLSKVNSFNSYFAIIYPLIIVLMSITMMNKMIISQIRLFTDSSFLICSALIIYFTLFALIGIFWLYGLNSGKSFRLNIYRIMAYVNLSVNLIFTLAILWMRRKQEFTPQQ